MPTEAGTVAGAPESGGRGGCPPPKKLRNPVKTTKVVNFFHRFGVKNDYF